jgi:hypothetical protein
MEAAEPTGALRTASVPESDRTFTGVLIPFEQCEIEKTPPTSPETKL